MEKYFNLEINAMYLNADHVFLFDAYGIFSYALGGRAMKVFLSWSGEKSKEIAQEFRVWLPAFIQYVRPFFTPDDIERGARWGNEIATELENSSFGIFFLTRENLKSPWIMFEAGAISKNIGISKVCPILFDVDKSDMDGPLVQFQVTSFNKEEIYHLIKSINSTSEHSLDEKILESAYEIWWPNLSEKVDQIIGKYRFGSGKGNIRSDRELLEEILQSIRGNARFLERFSSDTPKDKLYVNSIVFVFRAFYSCLECFMKRPDIQDQPVLDEIGAVLRRCRELYIAMELDNHSDEVEYYLKKCFHLITLLSSDYEARGLR